jgi:sugar lactone lactonase YvrE
MSRRQIVTVLDGMAYLESPRWHDDRIWVSDFYTGEVLSARADGSDRRLEAMVASQPSGLGWLPDGRLLIVSMRGVRLLRREPDGSLVTHADLSQWVRAVPNDMVLDELGRAYVGEFGFDLPGGAEIETGSLLRVDPDGTVTRAADGLWFPNGCVITPDRAQLIVAETFGNRISAFALEGDGRLGARRDWACFGPLPASSEVRRTMREAAVVPDGCALDAEGLLWVADATGRRVLRVREGGEIVDTISCGMGVFACELGGSDGRTLFMCAAPDAVEPRRRAAREARLLATEVAVPSASHA